MLSAEVNEWKLKSEAQDFKLWLWTCTTLLSALLVDGPLQLAHYLFIELLKGQKNLCIGVDLNQFCNALMVKLLNRNYMNEILELYYWIKPHFHTLDSVTYRALLVLLVSHHYLEMAQNIYETSVLTNIYPNMELKKNVLHITLYSDLLQEEIYMILKNFFHHLLKERYLNLQVNPDPDEYKVTIFIKPGSPLPAQPRKDFPYLLFVDSSLSAIHKRVGEVLDKCFPEIKYYVDERLFDDIILDPRSVIKYFQSDLYLLLSH